MNVILDWSVADRPVCRQADRIHRGSGCNNSSFAEHGSVRSIGFFEPSRMTGVAWFYRREGARPGRAASAVRRKKFARQPRRFAPQKAWMCKRQNVFLMLDIPRHPGLGKEFVSTRPVRRKNGKKIRTFFFFQVLDNAVFFTYIVKVTSNH